VSESKTIQYEGEQADVQWNERLCIHNGECSRAHGDLFVGGRKPWCQPDVTSADEVVEIIERCPTGALTCERKDGGTVESVDAENTVTVANDGPLYVRGDLEIEGVGDDYPGTRFRAALCRCGRSKNKPFCDNSHIDAGFRDSGAVGESGDGGAEAGGTLSVNPVTDGPLVLNGNFSILAGSGRVAWLGAKAALCRCGHSKNKPFCDGSHKEAGFKSG